MRLHKLNRGYRECILNHEIDLLIDTVKVTPLLTLKTKGSALQWSQRPRCHAILPHRVAVVEAFLARKLGLLWRILTRPARRRASRERGLTVRSAGEIRVTNPVRIADRRAPTVACVKFRGTAVAATRGAGLSARVQENQAAVQEREY